jgi:dihydrofolate reductase
MKYEGSCHCGKIAYEVEGGTYFPEFDWETWEETSRQDFKADEKNGFNYSFVILEKN